jgi:hypothetical protein
VVALVAVAWLVSPASAVVMACLSVAVPDFRRAAEIARSVPDKAGSTICARFTRAWGAWKVGTAGFVMMFVSVGVPLLVFMGCMFVGPVVILVLLDMVGPRVIADRPAKFGPKVAAVGKWKA